MRPQNVFLSSPDPQSDALADFRMALTKQGFKVFTNDGISPDSDLARNEITIADSVVVGLVETESQSDRFHKEITNALDAKKQIIVVQLEGDTIPQRLQNYAVIDLRNNFEMGLQLVAIAISGRAQTAIPMTNTPMTTPATSPTTSVPNMIPKRFDSPISTSKPMAKANSSPISNEAANPATVIAVMFAIVLIGFVVLTNLPLGNQNRGVSNVSERDLSGEVVEFSTPNVRITLPNSWENSTSLVTGNQDIQTALGLSGLGSGSIQMALSNRDNNNALFILTYPLNGQSQTFSLQDILDSIQQTATPSGITINDSRISSYSFGDALYIQMSLADGSLFLNAYMIITFKNNNAYMVMFGGANPTEAQFNGVLEAFEIINDASRVW